VRPFAVLAAVVAALVLPGAAFAHATLLHTTPANGAVLAKAPTAITVTFDDSIRVAKGNAAVDNRTQASVLAGKASAHGRDLTIPLKPLADGAYSVRWSIVSEDGHREEGVLAFAVGEGSGSPASVLGASVTLTWSDILLRSLYYLGVLAGGGFAVFAVLARRIVGPALQRPLAHLVFFSLLLAFLGGSGILHTAPPGTRFALVMKVALTVSLAGGAAAALAPTLPQLLPVAYAATLALLAAPTLSGHALDRDQPRVLAAIVDLAHMTSAAVWFGGLISIVYALPRATGDDAIRRAAVARFSKAALVSVIVLGTSGLVRAYTELSAVSQIWSTSYGRALLVKTAIFVPLLGIGWLNRTVLMRVFAHVRRSARVEVVAIVGIVVAVAILTELAPGRKTARSLAAAPQAVETTLTLPPRDAVVDARELGSLAVGVAREPQRTTVTIIGPDAAGVEGGDVPGNGVAATAGGAGGFGAATSRGGALRVAVGDRTLTFDIAASAPDATALLARITRAYRASRTIVFDETLASSPTNAQTTRWTVVAPHTLSYETRGGPGAIVIGTRRWDRPAAGAAWQPSSQTPIDVTAPYWTRPTNAHLVGPDTITFLDRGIPAFFRLTFKGRSTTVSHMTAAAHFMTDRYVGFDVPAGVSPPSR
jgi:copper transport protein